jgi:hypothetical protein
MPRNVSGYIIVFAIISQSEKTDLHLPFFAKGAWAQHNASVFAAEVGWLHNGYATKKPTRVEWAKPLNPMVAGDGIEPPTRGFSIPCSTN